jgi:hypothetical protein
LVTSPKQKGTIQEIIDWKYGTFEELCKKEKTLWKLNQKVMIRMMTQNRRL